MAAGEGLSRHRVDGEKDTEVRRRWAKKLGLGARVSKHGHRTGHHGGGARDADDDDSGGGPKVSGGVRGVAGGDEWSGYCLHQSRRTGNCNHQHWLFRVAVESLASHKLRAAAAHGLGSGAANGEAAARRAEAAAGAEAEAWEVEAEALEDAARASQEQV